MKAKDNITILKANYYFNHKQFDKVIRILEPVIFNYRDNFNFYFMLGISHLYKEDLESADSYLKRAGQLDDENMNIIKSLALINLKKGKWDDAIKMYLKILDLEPKNKIAKYGLNFIRKNVNMNHNVKTINLKKLYPVIKMPGKIRHIALIIFTLLTAISILVFFFLPKQEKFVRPGMDKYVIPAHKPGLIEYGSNYKFILTEAEIKNAFAKAKIFFNQYRDNMALVEINRLLNSNASLDIKNMAVSLKEFLQKPEFSTIKDLFSFTTVKRDPLLYNDCYVIWRGKIGNLNVSPSAISFDLWIGNSKEFEGVVPVLLDFALLLENGQEIEILGQVNYIEENLIIKGMIVHKLLLQE